MQVSVYGLSVVVAEPSPSPLYTGVKPGWRGGGEGGSVKNNWHAHPCAFPMMNIVCHIWKDEYIQRNISVTKNNLFFLFF